MPLQPNRPLLQVQHVEDTTRVQVAAHELGESNAHAFREAVFHLVEEVCPPRLLLDLGEVTYLTSTALGTLVSLHKRVRAADGELIVTNVTAAVYELFQVTRLHQLLDVRPEGDGGPSPVPC
jgi:anti-sigma B factor antagonist